MDLMKLKALLGIPEGDKTQDIALQFLMEDVDCLLYTSPSPRD